MIAKSEEIFKKVILTQNTHQISLHDFQPIQTPRYYPYSKAIGQLLVVPVPKIEVKELTVEELQAIPSERGTGALGSSGK